MPAHPGLGHASATTPLFYSHAMDSVGLMTPWLTLKALHKSESLLGSFPTITLAGIKFLSLQVD